MTPSLVDDVSKVSSMRSSLAIRRSIFASAPQLKIKPREPSSSSSMLLLAVVGTRAKASKSTGDLPRSAAIGTWDPRVSTEQDAANAVLHAYSPTSNPPLPSRPQMCVFSSKSDSLMQPQRHCMHQSAQPPFRHPAPAPNRSQPLTILWAE
ncbi:hypothetical protein CCHR01_09492 [Colletotrichum chrysophilum]|uniref:Uncharacterized protein n=1 Tax=Colletotrichum chrysophilum TaxID=1836956 RepID=A0AAD9AHU2_9PEZI|nr:hypothetical protein CCHR01_09492 [Colletotrichum chrysophilum]